MDLTLTEDQELIQSTARDVLTSWAPKAGVRAVRAEDPGYSRRLWTEMTELGWTGLAVDERYGGVGEGFLEACLLLEEAGAALVPSPLLYTLACAALPISRFGTEVQRERWLNAIAAGRPVGYLRAAPGGRWSGGSELVASGDESVLDGVADFVPYAAGVDGFVALARTGDALTCFLLDATRTEGLSWERLPVLGPEPYYRVRLDGVRPDSVLGEVGGGAEVVAAIDAYGAAASCAEMIGGAAKVLDVTVEYAGQREQFGRPIGSFQVVQHHCANMASDVLGARFIGYEAIWRLAGGPGADVGDPAEVALTVAAAKSWVSDAYQRVCALGQQVHGAVGFTAEHDLHLYSEHATAAALRFGDADFHTDRVADALGLPAT
jgi:alkylation response protein AidB-like acyl-CoA dehydrogenase